MTSAPNQHERRAAQRFDFNLPVSILANEQALHGCTQNLSGRGMFLLCDRELPAGSAVELTFSMPAEITLAEAMRVRCRGHVLRVTPAAQNVQFGMAVYLDSYEYLTAAESTASSHDFERISCLHQREAPFSRQSRVFKSA